MHAVHSRATNIIERRTNNLLEPGSLNATRFRVQATVMRDDSAPGELAAPAWAERWVRFLADGLVVPGTKYRIGFDGLAGMLIPGAGDALGASGALSLFWLAVQRGVPRIVLVRMALNVAIDALVGAVPIVGDLFDFAWKANRRNLRLIERAQLGQRARSTFDYVVVGLLGLLIASTVLLPIVVGALLIASLLK